MFNTFCLSANVAIDGSFFRQEQVSWRLQAGALERAWFTLNRFLDWKLQFEAVFFWAFEGCFRMKLKSSGQKSALEPQVFESSRFSMCGLWCCWMIEIILEVFKPCSGLWMVFCIFIRTTDHHSLIDSNHLPFNPPNYQLVISNY